MFMLAFYLFLYWLYFIYTVVYFIFIILICLSYNINIFNRFRVELNCWNIIINIVINIIIIINIFLSLLWGYIIFKAFISI